MVKRVALFKTEDGEVFDTEKAAIEHEAKVASAGGVNTLLKNLKMEVAVISTSTEGEPDIFLGEFLLNNRALIIEALTGAGSKKTRAPRKPKEPKEPKEPKQKATTAGKTLNVDAELMATAAIASGARADVDHELLLEEGDKSLEEMLETNTSTATEPTPEEEAEKLLSSL